MKAATTNVNEVLTESPDHEAGVLTIAEFCTRYKLSRAGLYILRQRGLGPDILQLGRKVLITRRAAAEWETRMTERSREAKSEAAA